MKRIIAAAILTAAVIFFYIFGYFFIDKSVKKAEKLLESCAVSYETSNNAKAQSVKLQEFWSDIEGTLSVFANHAIIDDIELAIGSLSIYSNTDQNEIFMEYWATVKTLLHQLMEDTKPSAHSIL